MGPGFDPLTTHQRFGKDIGSSDVFFLYSLKNAEPQMKTGAKIRADFKKRRFPASLHQMP
ncbi:hypothetical protein FC25_GL001699 [Ligilactobacillus ruminis DSM 20403 = NBRC 102161]|nr:hypothetical protein FC25_GL001699 [Ligilactobacillus ruminis DSM 20403 = NBRC 102161]